MKGKYKGLSITLVPGMKVKLTLDLAQAKKIDLKTFNCGLDNMMHRHFGKIVTINTVEHDHFTIDEDCCFRWNPYWIRKIMIPKVATRKSNPSEIRNTMSYNLFKKSVKNLTFRYHNLN